jgi:hypothetical protein
MSQDDPSANQSERSGDEASGKTEERSVVDRRSGIDTRPAGEPERRSGRDRRDKSGLERLRGPGRRRPEFNRAAEEGEFSSEQFLFVAAIDAFKRANRKSFPTWTEVLEVMRKLGYRKTQPMELNLTNAEDWTEPADAPAMPPEPEKAEAWDESW